MSSSANVIKFRWFRHENLKRALHVKEFNRFHPKTLFLPLYIFSNLVYVAHVSLMGFAGYFNIVVKRV